MTAFFISFALVFAAEFGDKTQLVALAFATRYRAMIVLAGITAASLVTHLLSVIIGQMAGSFIPQGVINLVAGLAFIAFGFAAIKSGQSAEEEVQEHRLGPFVSVALTFFVAELGDKTMLATIAIASQQRDFIGVWLGSSLGMILAGALAIWLGQAFGKRVPEAMVRTVAAVIFFATGIATLARAAFAH